VIVLQEVDILIPTGIHDLATFRDWVHGPGFPERGRIDWVQGRMEVDMSPEDLNTHGSPKSATAARLVEWVQDPELGTVFIDSTRIASVQADLSAEPDILVLLPQSLETGRATLVAKASAEAGRYIEIQGAADLAVEFVSDSSTKKDNRHLRKAYHDAGIREYWIVDARHDPLVFELLRHRPQGYEPSLPDAEGFRHSEVLGRDVRLIRSGEKHGLVWFRLESRPPRP
jgi:Uma2 family endonuclease